MKCHCSLGPLGLKIIFHCYDSWLKNDDSFCLEGIFEWASWHFDDKVSQGYLLHYKSLYEWNFLAWIFKIQRLCVQFKSSYILEVICLLLPRKPTYAWNNLANIFYSLIFVVTIFLLIQRISVMRQDDKALSSHCIMVICVKFSHKESKEMPFILLTGTWNKVCGSLRWV
jgi:hypothetical protein